MFCCNSVTHSYSPTLRKKIMTTDTGGKKTTQGLSPASLVSWAQLLSELQSYFVGTEENLRMFFVL